MSKIKGELIERIKRNDPSLRKLSLGYFDLDDTDIELLVKAMQNNTHIRSIDLQNNRVGDRGARLLASNNRITRLTLDRNPITAEGVKILAENSHITHLSLHGIIIGLVGAESLAKNNSITHLGVRSCSLGEDGAKTIAKNTRITHLQIAHNKIRDEGAKALADNEHIISLDVADNMITDIGGEALANNTHLLELWTSANFSITDSMQEKLENALHYNKKAQELQFIEQVIEIAKGRRPTQTQSLIFPLPRELVLIILSYVAGNAVRDPYEVTRVCKFLLDTIQSAPEDKLNLYRAQATKGVRFFKDWNPEELQEVRKRMAKKKPSIDEHLKEQETHDAPDKNFSKKK